MKKDFIFFLHLQARQTFPNIFEHLRSLPKTTEDLRGRTDDVSIIQQHIKVLLRDYVNGDLFDILVVYLILLIFIFVCIYVCLFLCPWPHHLNIFSFNWLPGIFNF